MGGVLAVAGSLLGAGFGVLMGAAFANFQWDHPRRMIRPGAQLAWGLGVGAIIVFMALLVQMGTLMEGVPALEFLKPIAPLGALLLAGLLSLLGVGLAARRIGKLEWT
jgi:hypothetical protein